MRGGRKPNTAKKSALADLKPEDRYSLLRYGEKCNPEAIQAVHAIHNALLLKTDPPDPSITEELKEEAWGIISRRYLNDWPKHDGSFFFELATAMEVHMRANDPCLLCVANEILLRESSNEPLPTAREMHTIAKAAGVMDDIKTIRRAFRYLDRKPAPDTRGAPKGKPHKSAHRADW